MTVHQENILSSKWRQQKFAVGKLIIIKNTKQEPDRLTTQAQHIEILMWPKDNLKKYDRHKIILKKYILAWLLLLLRGRDRIQKVAKILKRVFVVPSKIFLRPYIARQE